MWEDADQLTFDEALVQSLDLVPGSEQLVISSDRGGSRDLWLTTPNGMDMRPLTSTIGMPIARRESHRRAGTLRTIPTARETSTSGSCRSTEGQRFSSPATRSPTCSPRGLTDGAAIVYYGGRDDGVQLFVIPATGGEARHDDDGAWNPGISPMVAGRALALLTRPARVLRTLPDLPDAGRAAGTQSRSPRAPPTITAGRTTGRACISRGPAAAVTTLWERTLADGRERQLTRFIGRPGSLGGESLAASKTQLYFTWRHDLGDIWVMDVAVSR